jgi:hypothetical protein
MLKMRHIGALLLLAGMCLFAAEALAQTNSKLQPFTAEYQLNRGNMLIGKVTNTLRLEKDGSYTYTSITKPVGIVAAFSSDVITEISQGQIKHNRILPITYTYEHKRKKRPKFRKQQFDWHTNKLSTLAPKPQLSIDIPKDTQDKASMVLAMMLAIPSDADDIKIKVADKKNLKIYRINKQGTEQIKAGGSDYSSVKLGVSKPGKEPSTRFWLAPELNYLPVQIEKLEKKKTYTMTLVEYTPGQPAPAKK